MGSYKKLNTIKDFENATYIMPIFYPGKGDTGETITLRSRYSKEFREADAKCTRQISTMTMAKKGEAIDSDILESIENASFASLIAGWSFDEELTVDSITEFLTDNPQIRDEINHKAAQDTLFLKKEDKN